jgi:hypothetical protein
MWQVEAVVAIASTFQPQKGRLDVALPCEPNSAVMNWAPISIL